MQGRSDDGNWVYGSPETRVEMGPTYGWIGAILTVGAALVTLWLLQFQGQTNAAGARTYSLSWVGMIAIIIGLFALAGLRGSRAGRIVVWVGMALAGVVTLVMAVQVLVFYIEVGGNVIVHLNPGGLALTEKLPGFMPANV